MRKRAAEAGIAGSSPQLIYVGFAMSKIDEEEAQETLGVLRGMGEIYTDELQALHESRIE